MNASLKKSLSLTDIIIKRKRTLTDAHTAKRIGEAIARKNSARLKTVNGRVDPKDMWTKFRQLSNRGSHNVVFSTVTADTLNEHYAKISTDNNYVAPQRKLTVSHPMELNVITEETVFNYLDHLCITATGLDLLPSWFLRLGAPAFAKPIAELFNLSIATSIVPTQWKRACIRPINKVQNPTGPADFRPISITPVLSRTMEKIVVRKFLYPAILDPPRQLSFQDQFAFRPTGSTTAAIISILQTISRLLETNPYVVVYALDFSKAFDSVRHSTLLEKLALLQLPDDLYNWLVDFFEHREHCTVYDDKFSSFLEICASIIQGSGLGPASYIVVASDLHAITPGNELPKFADDSYLIVAAERVESRFAELENIKTWAVRNNLKLNTSKTVEIVFSKPRSRTLFNPPPPIPGIQRVEFVKILGVTIGRTFSMRDHVSEVLGACARSLYALRTIRSHGMSSADLQTIFRSVIVAKLMYAAPAWSGFLNAAERNRYDAFLKRSKRTGFCPANLETFSSLCERADDEFFSAIKNNTRHVLHHLLQDKPSSRYSLRERVHNFVLPTNTNSLSDHNFLNRILYKNIF